MKKLLFVYFLFTSVIINGQSINWMKFEKAASLANSKIIMVYFYNEDCSWCKRLEETTFVDNRIIKALRKDFLSVKINPKKKGKVKIRNIEYSYKDLAMKAKINNYPAYAFFYSNGRLITVAGGYRDSDNFFSLLEYVKNGVNN